MAGGIFLQLHEWLKMQNKQIDATKGEETNEKILNYEENFYFTKSKYSASIKYLALLNNFYYL